MVLDPYLSNIKNIVAYTSTKLTQLADSLIKKIKNRKDLFETTDIVFPSDYMVQWFKTHWLRTESDVLMNVAFSTIEDYLFDRIKGDKPFAKATRAEIRALTIKAILSVDKSHLDAKVSSYIYDDQSVNSIRLYDLGNELSKLFVEYEKDAFEIQGWQKEIYDFVLDKLESQNITTFEHAYSKFGLVKPSGNPVVFFGFSELEKRYIKPLESLAEITPIEFYSIEQSDACEAEIDYFSAPSKTREIEELHSKICGLIQDKKAKYSDILVLAPAMSEYERDIAKVFYQDGISFPNIPFSINDRAFKQTDVTDALKLFFEILSKRFFTRMDFSEIINNKVIQAARGISKDEIDNWQESIVEMNVFRNGKNIDDWKYAKTRLILSKASNINSFGENTVHLKDADYIPFSNIDFDDDSIIGFIEAIDDTNMWIESFAGNPLLEERHLNILRDLLTKWFSIKGINGFEENSVLSKLLSELNFWSLFGLADGTMPINTLFYTLFDQSQMANIHAANMFVDGVTFADYQEDEILPAKYLFIIGAGSRILPAKENRSEIDQRPDDKNQEEQYLKFASIASNASQGITFSYVDKNLKTDEEYFPSSYLLAFFSRNNYSKERKEEVKIDETRPWSELFTKKEFKEKGYYIGLLGAEKPALAESSPISTELIKKITVSKIKNFLDEPLKYKFLQLFGEPDDIANQLADEYEPIALDNLTKYTLVKAVLVYLLAHEEEANELVDDVGNIDMDLAREIFSRFIIEHKIPNLSPDIEDANIREILRTAFLAKYQIQGIAENGKAIEIPDFHFKCNGEDVVLLCNGPIYFFEKNNVRQYIELAEGKNDPKKEKPSYLLRPYVCSLADIAAIDNLDAEYTVELYRGPNCSIAFPFTPRQAQEVLMQIYQEMNDYSNPVFMPLDIVKQNKDFDQMVGLAMGGDYGVFSWKYFNDKKMFDLNTDLGFNRDNYDEISSMAKAKAEKMVAYLPFYEPAKKGKK